MKYIITSIIIIAMSYTLSAQKSLTITDLKKNTYFIRAGYYEGSLYLKYTTNAKTEKVAVIRMDDMEQIEEYNSGEAITMANIYGQIAVGLNINEVSIYNLKTKQETKGDFEIPKGWNADAPVVTYDPEHDLYYIFINVSEAHYWTTPKKESYQFRYSPKTNEVEKSTIPKDQDDFSFYKVLSSYVRSNKIICSGSSKGSAYATYDLSTQKFQIIQMDKHPDNVYAETLLDSPEGSVLGLHQANTTSQSFFYVRKTLYSIDIENAKSTLLGDYASQEGSSNIIKALVNPARDNYFSNTSLYSPNHWVTFSVQKEKFKLVKIAANELKIVDLDIGTPLSYSDVTDCYVQNGILHLKVNASGKLGGGKKMQVEIDIDKENVIQSNEVTSTNSRSKFFYTDNNGVDQFIESENDSKTGLKIYQPSK